jgi:predicted ATP-dependent serine protease
VHCVASLNFDRKKTSPNRKKKKKKLRSDYLFKLLLIGDSGVGKSCLLLRFAVSAAATLRSCRRVSTFADSKKKKKKKKKICLLLSGRHLHRELHFDDWRGLCKSNDGKALMTQPSVVDLCSPKRKKKKK